MRKLPNRSKKNLAKLSLLIVTLFYAFQFEMLWYGASQLKGQLSILAKRQPISEIMADDSFPDSLKTKIMFIDTIKEFCVQELGFKPNENYTQVVNLEGKPVLWTLSASQPYALEPYLWDYPILGKMGYKGYFDSLMLADEKYWLEAKGFDVCEGEVLAWSTLGFLSDPLLSSMLALNKGRLARLIIHELTHSEVFVNDDADLNENFATFIGDKGSLIFLKQRFGASSKEYQELKTYLGDLKILANYTITFKKELEEFYETNSGLPLAELENLKQQKMAEYMNTLKGQKLENPSAFESLFENEKLPKNCFFNDLGMYRNNQQQFEEELAKNYKEDLVAFLNSYKAKYGNKINPFR